MAHSSPISHLLPALHKNHLLHSDITPLIRALNSSVLTTVQLVGHSFENRPIHLLTQGQGPTVIFAWTQMHGNEATATAAVFDVIDQLITNTKDSLHGWEDVFTIHILPMLNPDGAQRFCRQNAQSIDINRDARQLQSPEGQLLMSLVEQLAPDIGFNLHDQSPYYQCGSSKNPATIAFLAPAFDTDKTINASRERSMLLIAHMNNAIQAHIPNCVARYNDSYCERSFGDNIAGKNVSTVLIESGAAKGDDNRQVARKMNVLSIISALEYLMPKAPDSSTLTPDKKSESPADFTISDYFAIPENISEALSSLVIRNLSFSGAHPYMAGISIKQTARYSNIFFIDFTGDLHTQGGLIDFDAHQLGYQQGNIFTPSKAIILNNEAYINLLREGYLYVHDPQNLVTNQADYDICYAKQPLHDENAFVLQQPAYCLLVELKQTDSIVYALLNGRLVDLR